MACTPNFERSISLNDLDSSLRVKVFIQEDIVTPDDQTKHCHLKSASSSTFVLPSFRKFSLDFKKFLYSYLLDVVIYKELEESKKLNWCQCLFPMVPVLTLGDGNCLMHAASIGMWAVNDRYHILRKLVYNAILEDTQGVFHKRWQREHEITNLKIHGYSMSEEQWVREWQIIIELVSQEEYPIGQNGMQYGSLEEIHIFILANVLRRTIIVISNDTIRGNYDESLSPVNFPGIYLPLNWDPIDCVKTPLVIGYTQGHFTSIVSFEDGVFDQGEVMDGLEQFTSKIHGVPLQGHDGTPLPIHFLFEDEVDLSDGLLRQYLDCTKLSHKDPHDGSLVVTLAAKLHFQQTHNSVRTLVDGFFSSAAETYRHMVQAKGIQAGTATPSIPMQHCRTKDCEFFGTSETLFLCSKCLERHLRNEVSQVVPSAPSAQLLEHTGTSAFREEKSHQITVGANNPLKEDLHYRTPGANIPFSKELPARTAPGVNAPFREECSHQRNVGANIPLKEDPLPYTTLGSNIPFTKEQPPILTAAGPNAALKEEHSRQRNFGASIPLREEPTRLTYGGSNVLREEFSRTVTEQQRQALQQLQRQENVIQQEPQRKKCITNGCKYDANEGDLCYRCYESEVQAEQQAASIVSMNIQAKLCVNSVNGCQYYGIPQQDDFCSRCYRRFCLEMESRFGERSEETASQSAPITTAPPENVSKTTCSGCRNTGCPELYGKCVQCYSECIRNFITSHDIRSLQTFASSAQPPPSSQASPPPQLLPSEPSPFPQPLLIQSSPSPQITPPPPFERASPQQRKLCVVPGCQKEGVPRYKGQCSDCHSIKPITDEHLVTMTTKSSDINMSSNETPTTFSGAHVPITSAGLPSGEPAIVGNEALFCKKPRCCNPLGESCSSLCTKCILNEYQKESMNLQQQQLPPPNASVPGMTEGRLSGENQATGLGAAGNGIEKAGHNHLQRSASDERQQMSQAAARARQGLTPLFIPPATWNTPQVSNSVSAGTPGRNIKCVAPNCSFYGISEHNYYCSTCYEKSREEWTKISDMARMAMRRQQYQDHLIQEPFTRDPRAAGKPHPLQQCALAHCYNLETPGKNGLCDRCYRTAVLSEKEWQSSFNRNRFQRIEPQGQLPIHVPTTSSSSKPLKKAFVDTGGPCKTSGCFRFGTPAKQGLCEPCFEKRQREEALRTTASGSSIRICVAQQRTSPPNDWSNATKVPYTQSPIVSTTFCAHSPIPVSQISTAPFVAGIDPLNTRCKQEGCRMNGTSELGGYCSRCFSDYTRMHSYPESIPDHKNSPETEIMTNSPTSVNGSTLSSPPTTTITTITGGLTTLQPGTPRFCAGTGCNNYVSPSTVIQCRDCLAKYYPNTASRKDQEEQ